MKREILKPVLVAALLAIGLSSLAGCYYDDHDDWRARRDGYYHHYDRDDYGYRHDHDRDYGWRGRFEHDHDDD